MTLTRAQRDAIEGALPCYCADQSQTCPRGFAKDVLAAVAPLLAAERERREALQVDADTLDAIEAVNDRTCPQCRTHIISVSVERDAARGRNRIVWTCSNGCQALDGEGPFQWTDYLDEELDKLHHALMAERERAEAAERRLEWLRAYIPTDCCRGADPECFGPRGCRVVAALAASDEGGG